MEIVSKIKYDSVLSDLIEIEKESSISEEKTVGLKDAVNNMNLLIPVVGEFSAGKSSLLNKFIGKKVLSVGMAPETAIPAELYYSENEYSEGVFPNGHIERIDSIENASSKYICVKRYINSQFLKDIQPVVLVDMPGFDSPLDSHNKAIFNYLDRGCHYVVITPVDAGTVSSSMSKQIQNILTFNKKCSFFISKTDLRSPEEVEQVKQELAMELESIIGENVIVHEICQQDISLFNKFTSSLNPDELFCDLFSSSVKESCYDVKASLNTKISALKADKKKNDSAIAELKNSIKKIEEKKEKLIKNANMNNYAEEAESIANEVGRELNSQIDSLASIAKSGGSGVLQEEMNSIIQNVVASKINGVITSISTKLSNEFSNDLSNLNEVFIQYNVPEFMTSIQNSAKKLFDTSTAAVAKFLSEQKGKANSPEMTSLLTAAGGIFSVATSILNPVVEIIIILLPSIINMIMGKTQEQQQLEKIKQSIIGQIPVIKREIRCKISQVLNENSSKMISSISEKYDEELRHKTEEIEQAAKEIDKTSDIENKLQKLELNVAKVDKLILSIL